jgi:putative membrane protein
LKHLWDAFYSRGAMAVLGVAFLCSSYFMARFSDVPVFSQASSIFIVAMAAPSYAAVVMWRGARRGLTALTVLSILPVLVEAAAIFTGFPYGEFTYSGRLGYMVLGVVPWSVAFAYPPILLGSMVYSSRLRTDRLGFSALSAIFNVAVDLAVDPGAVHIGFWNWAEPGAYYGVPLVNFLGWVLTGFLYANVFYSLMGDGTPIDARVSSSLFLVLCFWAGYLLINGLYLPAALGLTEAGLLLREYG